MFLILKGFIEITAIRLPQNNAARKQHIAINSVESLYEATISVKRGLPLEKFLGGSLKIF
jgi:hypothetical protein